MLYSWWVGCGNRIVMSDVTTTALTEAPVLLAHSSDIPKAQKCL
jgi:hypothetical protein